MGDLTANLSRHEFACKCGCGFDTVDYELVIVLQETVDHYKEKYPEKNIWIKINSGCRCKKHNTSVTGNPESKSQHLYGKAADFVINDVHEDEVAEYLIKRYHDRYGIGRYTGRTHFDSRRAMARWDNR